MGEDLKSTLDHLIFPSTLVSLDLLFQMGAETHDDVLWSCWTDLCSLHRRMMTEMVAMKDRAMESPFKLNRYAC